MLADDQAVFKVDDPPQGWQAALYGARLPLDGLGGLPSWGSSVLAATRVTSPAERDAVIKVEHALASMGEAKPAPRFLVRIWFDDRIVYDARSDDKDRGSGGPLRIGKGENNMLLECRSEESVPVSPGSIAVQFLDARDGREVPGLLFDIERRQETR